MNGRSLLPGLVLGVAAGWFAARLGGEPEPTAPEAHAPAPASAGTQASQPVTLRGDALGATPVESAPDEATLTRRLHEANRTGDREAFEQALHGLGGLGTRTAHEALVAAMRDPAIVFPPGLASSFHDWLKDADVEGIADAAKARFAIRREAGWSDPDAGHGWFTLIGAHDGEAALAWAREEGLEMHASLWRHLVDGLLFSSGPEALAFARRIATADPADPSLREARLAEFRRHAFDTWARLDPAAAIPAVVAEIDRAFAGTAPPGALHHNAAGHIYGARLPEASFAGAAAVIRRLAKDEPVPEAAYRLARRLQNRDLPLDGLEDLLLRPAVLLESFDAQGGPKNEDERLLLLQARDAILRSSMLWSDRSLEAVEQSATWDGWEADREGVRRRLLQVEAERRWAGGGDD